MSDRGRTAACLAVGSELLGESKLDRNSLTITREVERYGIRVAEKRVVGDDVDTIARAVRELVERHDLVTVTGGLGPTADDVTREAVARALGREIRHSDEVEAWIRERYADQVIRCASSVPANLSEGHGRSGRDRIHHWRIAFASAKEVDAHLRLLARAGAVDSSRAAEALDLFDQVRAMTWRLLHPKR
jgi:molybdenum cofactor synthesis domain-containing protein